MIRSKELTLYSSGDNLDKVLEEADAFASFMGLPDKESRYLRLITEETIGMIRTITGELSAKLVFSGGDESYTISLETITFMDIKKHDELLALSKSGKNESAKGVMGKIREAFELANMIPDQNSKDAWMMYGSPAMTWGMPNEGTMFMSPSEPVYWTLKGYRSTLDADKESDEDAAEAWDELEKSIVGNLADDIKIGIRNGHVQMDVIRDLKH